MPRVRSCFLLLFLALAACTAKPHRELRVGMELASPPFEMTDEHGKPAGVSVDLAQALADSLGRPLVIENIPFQGLITSLRTGKIDLILSSLTATPERRESIDFSDPYLTTGLALLVRAQSDIQSAADLARAGRTIVVKKGTTGELYANRSLHEARVLVLDQENTCVLEVAQGKADAFIYDQLSTLQNHRGNRETTRPLLQPFTTEEWAIGLRKGDDELRGKVNVFLAQYRQAGGFQKLGDRWLHEQKAAFAELGIPFVF